MRRPLLLLLLFLVPYAAKAVDDTSSGCRASSLPGGRRLERSVMVDGHQRNYILDVPDTVKAGAPVSLLFDFHGFGHSGAGVWKVSQFKDIAAREPLLTVYPEGETVHLLERDGAGWEIFKINGNRDLAFVRRMLEEIESTYCIDRKRVFATGFSNGAFFSHLLACTMADRFAAVAPVSGGALNLPCQPSRPVPILIQHGRNDPVVKVERGRQMRDLWVANNHCEETSSEGCELHRGCRQKADVTYCEDDGEHHWPATATSRIWDFLRAHPMETQP